MAHITIVGLGPGHPSYLTREAEQVLADGGELWVRDRSHPVLTTLGPRVRIQTFDHDVLGEQPIVAGEQGGVVSPLLALAQRPEGVIYGVAGFFEESQHQLSHIVQAAEQQQLGVRWVPGISAFDLAMPHLAGWGGTQSDLHMVSAEILLESYAPPLDPGRATLIVSRSRANWEGLQKVLRSVYPDDSPITCVDLNAHPTNSAQTLTLRELNLGSNLSSFALLVAPLAPQGAISYLRGIIAYLRTPEGCPWDREQTYESLRSSLYEEAAEVLDAIDRGDREALCEELGDLLANVLMQSQIAAEQQAFTLHDVITSISTKLVRRHPHVFGDAEVQTVDDLYRTWDAIKQSEKAAKGQVGDEGLFVNIPTALPALSRAQKVAGRARKAGRALWAPEERWGAWKAAPNDQSLGDLLMALAATSNDPESALREALSRFIRQTEVSGES